MIKILWFLFYIIDISLFAFVALTVLYLLVFAFAHLFTNRPDVPKAKHYNRFIILIPAYRKDDVVMHAVNAALGQSYPQRMFDIVVISDHQQEMTNMRLAQLPITLLTPDFEQSSRTKSLQYAILNLPQFKIYDAAIILGADDIIEPEFLDQMNDAFESSGTKAIQAHRISRNRDTSAARLDAIFEEINNSIFRKGHIGAGLSAALNGSGMAYNYEWFKHNIMQMRADFGEEKELEARLLHERIYIDYFEHIHVYDEKTRNLDDFNKKRRRWASSQLHTLLNNLKLIPSAILNQNYDLLDKLVQWMLVPRTIMMGIIFIMSLTTAFFVFSMAIKWWIVGALALLAFSIATPDYLVDEHWDQDFLMAPIVIFMGILNIFHVGHNEAEARIGDFSGKVMRLKDKLTDA